MYPRLRCQYVHEVAGPPRTTTEEQAGSGAVAARGATGRHTPYKAVVGMSRVYSKLELLQAKNSLVLRLDRSNLNLDSFRSVDFLNLFDFRRMPLIRATRYLDE